MVDDFVVRPETSKAENTDPRMSYVVKYATARGRPTFLLT